jgi:hypothetical protein
MLYEATELIPAFFDGSNRLVAVIQGMEGFVGFSPFYVVFYFFNLLAEFFYFTFNFFV